MLPDNLIKTIQEAQRAVEIHPWHDLNLGYRQMIWNLFGSYTRRKPGPYPLTIQLHKSQGLQRRTRLAILSVQRVLSAWENSGIISSYPPRQILFDAEQVLAGQIDQTLPLEKLRHYSAIEIWYGIELRKPEAMVSEVYAAAVAALFDETFDPLSIDTEFLDVDIGFEKWDASIHAANVYSGGVLWYDTCDYEKRLEFWQWWLSEAVPEAWQLA